MILKRINDEIATTSQASNSKTVSEVSDSNAAESEDNDSDAKSEVMTQEVLRALNIFFMSHKAAEEIFQNYKTWKTLYKK